MTIKDGNGNLLFPQNLRIFSRVYSNSSFELLLQGASDQSLARIHAPIGLNIGAVSPSEIAVAIMAEITARLRLPADAPLKTKSAA